MSKNIFSAVVLSLLLTACADNGSSSPAGNLQLSFSGLEPMTGQHYEGWVISDGVAISTGRFNIDGSGNIISVNQAGQKTGDISETNIGVFNFEENEGSPSSFILTIEPDNDSDDGPSAIHLVAGDFNGTVANSTTEHPSAINVSFSASMGTYILATPTTTSTADENQGVWFLNSGSPSLTLPALPSEWAYEGWVVNTASGTPISTGVFSSAIGSDSNGAGPSAGPNSAPPFPGEDFISPDARMLNNGNYNIVISIEPVPDLDPATPFALKILLSEVANGQASGGSNNHNLSNIDNSANISIEATLL